MQVNINSIHLLCLDGLLSILDGIEGHCTMRMINPNTSSSSSSSLSDESNSSVFYHEDLKEQGDTMDFGISPLTKHILQGSRDSEGSLPTHEQLMAIRHKKKATF
jgi:hypothetical protein